MRILNLAALDELDDVEAYGIRSTVDAVRCDEGVTISDKDGNVLARADGNVVLVIDGDDYAPIPAHIFDALYAPTTGVTASPTLHEAPAPAEPAPAPTDPSSVAGTAGGTAGPTGESPTGEGQTASVAGLSDPGAASEPVPTPTP